MYFHLVMLRGCVCIKKCCSLLQERHCTVFTAHRATASCDDKPPNVFNLKGGEQLGEDTNQMMIYLVKTEKTHNWLNQSGMCAPFIR